MYYAESLYPFAYALGNADITPTKAAIFSGFLLTIAGRAAKDILPNWGIKTTGRYKKFVVYWLVNSAAIWLIARFAFITGFGISSYYYALALGFVSTFLQWIARQVFKKAKLV